MNCLLADRVHTIHCKECLHLCCGTYAVNEQHLCNCPQARRWDSRQAPEHPTVLLGCSLYKDDHMYCMLAATKLRAHLPTDLHLCAGCCFMCKNALMLQNAMSPDTYILFGQILAPLDAPLSLSLILSWHACAEPVWSVVKDCHQLRKLDCVSFLAFDMQAWPWSVARHLHMPNLLPIHVFFSADSVWTSTVSFLLLSLWEMKNTLGGKRNIIPVVS